MAGKPKFPTPPASPINKWVRDAVNHSGKSYPALATALTAAGLGNYDRSMVQKMTVSRGVSAEEAAVISRATGFPLPENASGDDHLEKYRDLTPEDRRVVDALIDRFYAQRLAGRSSR